MAKIGIILGSIRDGRNGESVAKWVADQAAQRSGEVEYVLVDLLEFDLPLLTSGVNPAAANKKYDDAKVQAWSDAIDELDGYVFVTGEYNHSVPGAFKNAFDSLGQEWVGKPVAFVGYGAAGGVRSVEHWRAVVSNFSMIDIRNQIDLNLFTEFGDAGVAPNERRAGELEAILDELEQWVKKLA